MSRLLTLFVSLLMTTAFGAALNASYFVIKSQYSGQALTTTILSNSMYGNWCTVPLSGPMLSATNNPIHPNGLFNISGVGSVIDYGSTCIAFGEDGLDDQFVDFIPFGLDDSGAGTRATNANASAGCWIRTDMQYTAGVAQHDTFALRGQNDFLLLYFNTSYSIGNVVIGVESTSWEDPSQNQIYTPNSWVWVTAWSDSNALANVNLSVYDINTNLIHTWTHVRTGSGTWSKVRYKFQSNGFGGTSGYHVYYSGPVIDFTTSAAILPQSAVFRKTFAGKLGKGTR